MKRIVKTAVTVAALAALTLGASFAAAKNCCPNGDCCKGGSCCKARHHVKK